MTANTATLRVALFTRYTRLGASSRLRTMQYLPLLQDAGIQVEIFPLFDDDYLSDLYVHSRRTMGRVVGAYVRRLVELRRTRSHDLLWIEKELLPFVPWPLERVAMPAKVPVVVDYDDAVFHNYDLSPHSWVRRLLSRKIDRLMATADVVCAGNSYLAARALTAGARRVEVVPTVVDIDRYTPRRDAGGSRASSLVIGWIGSPATEHYLLPLLPMLQALCADGRARLVLVGASASMSNRLAGVPVQVQPWTEATEAAQIGDFDIGIMPLPDMPWERGKCGYKLIQYMACALPVVASPVGVNCDIVLPGRTGMLASTLAEWRDALLRLLDDPVLRRELGLAGRRRLEKEYAMSTQAHTIARLLRETAGLAGIDTLCAD